MIRIPAAQARKGQLREAANARCTTIIAERSASFRASLLASARLCAVLFCLSASALHGQSNRGELRLRVIDAAGQGARVLVHLASTASGYQKVLETSRDGSLQVQHLVYGLYRIEILPPGMAADSQTVTVDSPLPVSRTIRLHLAAIRQTVVVSAASTLINPNQPGSVDHIGPELLENRLSSIPGRAIEDLINSQPGWLYEGNAVLHPRGSEYQTQFVIDGIPLTDNRSPSFGPEIAVDNVESMNIYTAGIPAEFGRKMGGVVEINTIPDRQPGFHGKAVLSGGSFDTARGFLRGVYGWSRYALGGSAGGSRTGHYLNPVVPENYSNTGTLGDFSLNGEHTFSPQTQFTANVRHELARYDLPNEYLQQQGGQRQTAENLETMGIASWRRILSPHALVAVHGMLRENTSRFTSNPQSTPIEVFQHNWFREGYLNADVTIHRGRHEFTLGAEADNTLLNESLHYHITDPAFFDPRPPTDFSFRGNRPDLEQSAYAEDLIHLRPWTLRAGLRWDHYQLLLNEQAVEPRLSVSRYFSDAQLLVHFSYDRVFQTPSSENILLSSSPEVDSIDPESFLRLPVQPSRGNYYEVGVTQAFGGKLRLDANYFRRNLSNYADDDQIDNTTISFPIAFRKSIIYGLEGKVYLPEWKRFSGFLSYSYEVGNVWLPVTGGLFLGDDAAAAALGTTGHFPDSQDQRNTARGRVRYQVKPRLWFAVGAQFNSGLPFSFDGDRQTALAEYGPEVLDRLNFSRGRIHPGAMINASAGMTLYESGMISASLQADGENLNNLVNVIDFGGLFSGNAIGPARSCIVRMTFSF